MSLPSDPPRAEPPRADVPLQADPPPTRPVAPVPEPGERPLPLSPPPVAAAGMPAPTRPLAEPIQAPIAARLPAHQGKLERVTEHVVGLGEGVVKWVELKVEVVRTELTEQIEYRIKQAERAAAAGIVGALGAFFALVTLALGLGWLLGHAFWGFLIVTALLLIAAAVLWFVLEPNRPPAVRKP